MALGIARGAFATALEAQIRATLAVNPSLRVVMTGCAVREMDHERLAWFAEGRHERLWEILGAHPRSFSTPDGVVEGVSFAVWAPNAKGVSLIGDFNGWDGRVHPMRLLVANGIWELFVPGVPAANPRAPHQPSKIRKSLP